MDLSNPQDISLSQELEFKGEDHEENSESDSGSGDLNRWPLEDFNNMEMVCTFLDNEDDKLPDVFDPSKVAK
jgi:hypothetical protein